MQKIRTGDVVIVRAGRDKGSHGKVLRLFREKGTALVEGVRFQVRHTKPDPQRNITGGRIKRESPVAISNLSLYNPSTEKADKVIFKAGTGSKRVRCFRSSGELIS